jgi:uncharacterized protein
MSSSKPKTTNPQHNVAGFLFGILKPMRMVYPSVFILIALALAYGAYKWGTRDGAFTKTHTIEVSGEKVKTEVRDTIMGRAQGLSGRAVGSLGEHDGMLFIFASSSDYGFWMKDMNFPIDIVWISNDEQSGKAAIAGISENAMPEPDKRLFSLTVYHSPVPVRYVLEVPAGTSAKNGWKAGDEVKL